MYGMAINVDWDNLILRYDKPTTDIAIEKQGLYIIVINFCLGNIVENKI